MYQFFRYIVFQGMLKIIERWGIWQGIDETKLADYL